MSSYYGFKGESVSDFLDGMGEVSGMLYNLKSGEKDCKLKHSSWQKIDKFIDAWKSPKNFKYTKDAIMVNGVDIKENMFHALEAYNKDQWEAYGMYLGKASY